MTLRHGVSAAILIIAGVGWGTNPPPRVAGRRVEVAAACAALGAGVLAAGAWSSRRAAGKEHRA
jgi:hypothetical protein